MLRSRTAPFLFKRSELIVCCYYPKTGAQGGTRTHDWTDLQSATLAALSPVHNKLAEHVGIEPTHPLLNLAVTVGFEPTARITTNGTLAGC
jgi:hypothetical protein